MGLIYPKSLDRASGHHELPVRRQLAMALFVVLYGIAAQYAYSTAGEPYRVALTERERLDVLEQAKSNATAAFEAVAALAEPAVAAQAPSLQFGETSGDMDALLSAAPVLNATLTNATLPTEAEAIAAMIKAERPLPHEWLPNAWVCVGCFLLATFHALFYLMCHWSVDFKVRVFFRGTKQLDERCHVRFQPMPHKGKPAVVRLSRSARTGRLVCEFQRQHYEVLAAPLARTEDTAAELTADDGAELAIRLVSPPIEEPLRYYSALAQGLRTEDEVAARTEAFGPNIIAVRTPTFLELYVEQLLSPLAIFQIFTSMLWLLDAVSLGFTAFQVGSILMLESTTVFQRQRMLKMLNSMSAKPFLIAAYRQGKWRTLPTTALLPGDLISLRPPRKADAPPAGAAGAAPTVTEPGAPPAAAGAAEAAAAMNDSVPCDCVLIRGTAVVNEASLTGESVPQMKDRLTVDAQSASLPLEMNGRDRVHTLFAGTSIMSASQTSGDSGGDGAAAREESIAAPGVPPTPDGGALCFVLRTGFSSSQGELMQMIEFSQQQVSDDSRETLYALGLLLLFALASSGYVLRKGMERGDRTTHELLLKCVIIITSVVPRHLPMQTAMAVNTALMALMRKVIYHYYYCYCYY
ncbi:hypothetical protein T492DRAFT_550576 [Pavlovales sp. CCMP2436]|nr:hypothetical protein T492DRAFT_550576 [Pavlovales sp. CCMP2436]